ncbi:MAG: MTH938/NDUFAF3 family protein [Gammaproteobacteria bacterium]|jgi:hypothetical protein
MQITEYTFGKITINGKTYQTDVIITPHSVKDKWWRKQGHNLAIEDLVDVIATKPKVVIIGSGYYGRMRVPQATRDYLEERGIRLEVAETAEAIDRFIQLQQECAQIVAAFHLTC